jgi:hypothetical protein
MSKQYLIFYFYPEFASDILFCYDRKDFQMSNF